MSPYRKVKNITLAFCIALSKLCCYISTCRSSKSRIDESKENDNTTYYIVDTKIIYAQCSKHDSSGIQ